MPYCPTCRGTFPEGQFCPRDGTHLIPGEDLCHEIDAVDPLVGKVLADRFRIVSRLGSGGMGTVYQAEHVYIRKRVALKLLRPEITSNPDAVARFQREAVAASSIGHPSIVAIDDFGRTPDGQVYLTMEYLDGVPLNEVLCHGPISIADTLEIAIQTCHGLAAAHAQGIIHRDMKPDNLFLTEEGTKVKILDFGIAKMASVENTNLTKSGTVFGTPNYMAPEQALGKKLDHRVDIYAVGVMIYEMLTRQLPFRGDSFVAILTQHVTAAPVPPQEVAPDRQIPASLSALVLRAMAKDPDERYQDMGQIVAALLECRSEVVGDEPVKTQLRLSRIRPPAAALGPSADSAGFGSRKITPTEGELVGTARERKTRAPLFVALAAILVLAGSGTTWVLLGRGSPRVSGEPNGAAATRAALALPTVGGHGRNHSSRARTAGAPSHRLVIVAVDSVPQGASVERDGRIVGQTPYKVIAPAGARVGLELHLKGHVSQKLELEVKADEVRTVQLEKTRVATAPKRAVQRKGSDRGKKRTGGPGASGASDHEDGESDHPSGRGGSDPAPMDPYQ